MELIEAMTESEAKALLADIVEEFGIGEKAISRSVILTNIQNSKRRSSCLGRIENYLSETEIDEDGYECENSLLNWGEDPDAYIERFKKIVPNP